MRKSRRVLTATLAAIMFLTPVNVDAMWMQSPTIQKDNKVTYNTHYTIELKAVPYTDDTFSEKCLRGTEQRLQALVRWFKNHTVVRQERRQMPVLT